MRYLLPLAMTDHLRRASHPRALPSVSHASSAFVLPPTTTSLWNPFPAIALSLAICVTPNVVYALGVTKGQLQNCEQNRLTCVSSQDDTPSVFLEPWEHDGDIDELQSRLLDIILSEPRSRLVEQNAHYMRFELPSDDLELFFPNNDNIVHFRSARRDSGFDFLENRRRLERIRKKAGLTRIVVLRGRTGLLKMFETPFDRFAPSAIDTDAIIDYRGPGSRPMR